MVSSVPRTFSIRSARHALGGGASASASPACPVGRGGWHSSALKRPRALLSSARAFDPRLA